MAGKDPQKQLLTLIRDFASEKSQGERRVIALKKRVEELQSLIDATNVELEEAKRFKETTEQELKGNEVELAMNEATIQSLIARISTIQDEISVVGSDLEARKNEEGAIRDEFIKQMFEWNTKIRIFQKTVGHNFQTDNLIGTSLDLKLLEYFDFLPEEAQNQRGVTKVSSRSLEDDLTLILSQTTKVEEELQAEQNIQKHVQLELIDMERKLSIMEAITHESKEVLELTRQTSELEEMCTSLSDQLQSRCVCPSCHLENLEALKEFFC